MVVCVVGDRDRLSVIGRLGCARRSDSSAQVLRNSRPEFRLPGATQRGSYQIEYFLSDVDDFAGMDA